MKWFKHYSDASLDNKICNLEDDFGYVGYGVYWKIIEICSTQWDGKTDPRFSLNRRKTKSILSLNYKKTESILSLCGVLNLFEVIITEKNYEIYMPNLLKIKDNHSKNLQAKGNKVSEELPLEQNRTEQSREDKNIYTHEKQALEFWNSLKIIQHNESELNLKKIEKGLKKWGVMSDLQESFENYNSVLKDSLCFFSHKWTLWDFLTRDGAQKFRPENFIKENYASRNSNSHGSKYD